MNKMNIIQELEAYGAILHNQHIVLKSGRHAPDYINLDFMFPHLEFMHRLGRQMAEQISDIDVDALVAPATGGVALLQWVGLALERHTGEYPLVFWADKQVNGSFAFERADWRRQLRGLVVAGVEDITTTGGSLMATIQAAVSAGADVETAVAVCNRGGVTDASLGVNSFRALSEVDYPSFGHKQCPMCRDLIPIAEDIGHAAEFKKENPGYGGGYIKLLS